MKVAYVDKEIKEIFDAYVQGFKPPNDGKVVRYDTFHDTASGNVLFRLFVQEPGETETSPLIELPTRN
jgi:hypothetical protein